jgi:hypothetical protein
MNTIGERSRARTSLRNHFTVPLPLLSEAQSDVDVDVDV